MFSSVNVCRTAAARRAQATRRPRISTSNSVPQRVAAIGRYARPMDFFKQRRLRAARDDAFGAACIRLVAVTRNAGCRHLESDEFSADAGALLLVECGLADEIASSSSRQSSRDRPRAPTSSRRCPARTGACRFETQCVARAESDGHDACSAPASRIAFHTRSADAGGMNSSKPSSPV